MAPETVVTGSKRKSEEMLDNSDTEDQTQETEVVDDDETVAAGSTDELHIFPTLPARLRPILLKAPTLSSGWVPPVMGSFVPVSRPTGITSISPSVSITATAPAIGPVASDADGRPYPSPYNTYPSTQTILDYDIAKAKGRTPLLPTNDNRGPAEKYTSVLETDLAVTTGRLARANSEKQAAEEKVAQQAREIVTLRALVIKLEEEKKGYKGEMEQRMGALLSYFMENLPAGIEVPIELFSTLSME